MRGGSFPFREGFHGSQDVVCPPEHRHTGHEHQHVDEEYQNCDCQVFHLQPMTHEGTVDEVTFHQATRLRWWEKDYGTLATISSLYAMVLVSVYVAFTFTELVTFPVYQFYLEKTGFFIYLYLLSDIFLVYILWFTLSRNESHPLENMKVVPNHKSHGSLTIRLGAVIFGLGTLTYFVLETIAFLEIRIDSPCHYPPLGANVILAMVMVILQTYLIFVYPRLNLRIMPFIDRFGTMHLVATNIVLWIRTLVKESLHEIAEWDEQESSTRKSEDVDLVKKCNYVVEKIRQYEHRQEECMELHNDILGDAVLKSSPYLYPFVIEYVLIGASVLFLMWTHVGKLPLDHPDLAYPKEIHKPQPQEFLDKSDWSHTTKGLLCGLVVLLLGFANLGLFFGLDGTHRNEDEAEYYSKMVNTATNLIGIGALVVGLIQVRSLVYRRNLGLEQLRASDQLDISLLRFTAFFSFLYHNFTVITGSFNKDVENFPNALHIINGVVEATQMVLQMIFIFEMKRKAVPDDQMAAKPGREVTVFLFLLNLAQWVVFTFEIQKVRASPVEASFYGFMPWIIIQRVTLPLTVFFRFHSAVVSMELWKELYC